MFLLGGEHFIFGAPGTFVEWYQALRGQLLLAHLTCPVLKREPQVLASLPKTQVFGHGTRHHSIFRFLKQIQIFFEKENAIPLMSGHLLEQSHLPEMPDKRVGCLMAPDLQEIADLIDGYCRPGE